MSLWNPDNIKDVAESVGINSLEKDVLDNLGRDVDYRVSQVLEEAIKFMRHSRRTTLHTEDISQALRVLDVEPLFGYDSTRPLRFGEASNSGVWIAWCLNLFLFPYAFFPVYYQDTTEVRVPRRAQKNAKGKVYELTV